MFQMGRSLADNQDSVGGQLESRDGRAIASSALRMLCCLLPLSAGPESWGRSWNHSGLLGIGGAKPDPISPGPV